MYSEIAKAGNGVPVDEVYIRKLRMSIQEMISLKESAIQQENYALADQTRTKLTALRLQLLKMEHQFNADLITNFITSWHDDLALSLNMLISGGKTQGSSGPSSSKKSSPQIDPLSYPLLEKFHTSFIDTAVLIPTKYSDSLIKGLVIALPHDNSDIPKSPYGFDLFLRKLSSMQGKSIDFVEFVKSTLTLCVFDVIMRVTDRLDEQTITFDTVELLLKHVSYYVRTANFSKKANTLVEKKFFEKIMTRLAIIVGDVGKIYRQPVLNQLFSLLDINKKPSAEDIIMVLSTTRYISRKPVNPKEANEIVFMIRELCNLFEKQKKSVIRISVIQSLERIIQCLDYTASNVPREPWEVTVITEMYEIHKKARKWIKDDDLRSYSLRLTTVILVNSRADFFNEHVDSLLYAELFSKTKIKSYVYECVLQFLRGRYYLDTLGNARARAYGTFTTAKSFSYLTRPVDDENRITVDERMKALIDRIFVKRKGNIGIENLDYCVDIVVQIAAGSFPVAVGLISQLLDFRGNDNSAKFEEFYIGIHSLGIILDRESGFSSNAFSKMSPDFQNVLANAILEYESILPQILFTCDSVAGVNVFGKSSTSYEPIRTYTNAYVSKSLRGIDTNSFHRSLVTSEGYYDFSFSAYTSRFPEDDILATLSEAIDRTSFSSPDLERKDMSRSRSGTFAQEIGGGGGSRSRSATMSDASNTRSIDLHHQILNEYVASPKTMNSYATSGGGDNVVTGAISSLFSDSDCQEANESVGKAIRGWYEKCTNFNKTESKSEKTIYMLKIQPEDQHVKKSKAPSLGSGLSLASAGGVQMIPSSLKTSTTKPDTEIVLRLFIELMKLIPFLPTPELVGGQWFIGSYLIHGHAELSMEVSRSLQKIFCENPNMRLSIVNGFINFIKVSPNQDEASLCTMLMQLSNLISIWANEKAVAGSGTDSTNHIDEQTLSRVSCKLDALVLVMLCRQNVQIRKSCLIMLADMYTITEKVRPHSNVPGCLPLYAIILQAESKISRHAMFAFLEHDLNGNCLNPHLSGGQSVIRFSQVAVSDFIGLFKFFIGEVSRQFALLGRAKALRHCVKLLKLLAIPCLSTNATATPSNEFLAAYSSYTILLMSLAGVPDDSETSYTLGPVNTCDNLLFNSFRLHLAPIFNSDNTWEVKVIATAAYFLHRSVFQLMLVNLWQWFNDVKRSPKPNLRLLDNILVVLRHMCQTPDLAALLHEPSVFVSTITDVVSEFMSVTEALLNDMSFLSTGPSYRLKTAINYSVILQKISDGFSSSRQEYVAYLGLSDISEVVRNSDDGSPEKSRYIGVLNMHGFTGIDRSGTIKLPAWDKPARRAALGYLKEWYSTTHEVSSVMSISPENSKMNKLRLRLIRRIGAACEKIFNIGNPFEGEVSQDLIIWMAKMESSGFRVFTPEVLYTHDNALGTVLAHSYSGPKPAQALIFTDAVLDQILPRPRYGSDPFLAGEGAFLVATEEYTSALHEVQIGTHGSQVDIGFTGKSPLVDRNVVLRLRPNLGSLLYFGLYNMLNSNKLVRIRSFLLLKELFTVFNPDKQLDVNAYFAKFTGTFYSNVGLNLKTKLLNMSLLAADLFPAEAPGFLWEAVRCCRTIQKAERPLCLVSPQRWILELLTPWCRYIDLNTIKENLVNAEVFKFLMDSAFTANTYMETVQSCWVEVANSQVYGLQNSRILTDALIQVCGKVDKLRDQGLTLAAGIYSIHPSVVASSLCMQLSSSAFPWKQAAKQRLSSSNNTITDYVHSLHQTVYGTSFDVSNDYSICCKSAVMIISELVPQDCSPIIPFLPVLLNYIVLHLPSKLQESSVSTFLLANLLEGYIGMLHVTGKVKNPGFGPCVEKIRKLLTHFELPACFVDFEEQKIERNVKDLSFYTSLPISEFLDVIIDVFEKEYTSLREDFSAETLNWASEYVLGPEHSIRAIEIYCKILNKTRSTTYASKPFLDSRLVDQVILLSDLEQNLGVNDDDNAFRVDTSKSLATASSSPPPPPTVGRVLVPDPWSSLDESKRISKDTTETLICSILKLHLGIIRWLSLEDLIQTPYLFWISASFLHVPVESFSKTYNAALLNCSAFISRLDVVSKFDDTAKSFFALHDKLLPGYSGLQILLAKGLFHYDINTQERAFDLLLQSWGALPVNLVDPNPTNLFYTTIYSIVWLFSLILEGGAAKEELASRVANQIKEILITHNNSNKYTRIIECLSSNPKRFNSLSAVDEAFNLIADNIFDLYIPDCTVNLSEFFGYTMQSRNPSLQRVVLKLVHALWSSAKLKLGHLEDYMTCSILVPLRSFVRKLPFSQDNIGNIRELALFVLNDEVPLSSPGTAVALNQVNQVDIFSQGRVETFSETELAPGSFRTVQYTLQRLGLQPSTF